VLAVAVPAPLGAIRWVRLLEDRRGWQLAVFGLVVLRLVMWWLFQHDIPRMMLHVDWYFYHGGDQGQYFQTARDILAGHPHAQTASAGWSFVLAGLIRFAGGGKYDDILPEIVIGNGLLLALISIPVMAHFGLALSRRRWQAWCAAAVWTLLPYILWLGFLPVRDAAVLQNAYVSRQMWVSGITDGSSLLFVLLGAVLALRPGARAARGPAAWLWLAAAGLSLGWGAAIRIQMAPVAVVVLAVLLWQRQPARAAVVLAGCLIGFGPQFWYDIASTGNALNLPYFSDWVRFNRDGSYVLQFNNMPANPGALAGNLLSWVRRLPVLAAPILGAGLLGLAGFVRLWRRDSSAALVMFGLPALSFGLHVVTYVYAYDPVRYTLPAVSFGLPALIWTAASALDWSYRRVFRRTEKGSAKK
jgi:hypothetical protein